ncbi:iron uptake transporter permease EfeU [Streptacidiphilus sp. PAMC 29251]
MWDDAFPSFLIGLREGLEAGLVVSILVATLVRSGQKSRLPALWTGVLAAIALSLSFGAVLTFTARSLSATAQEAFGGTLSAIAVAFVTAMVFWMRSNARNLSGELKEKVGAALAVGSGMLVLTSFLAVGREGLETALFIWTTAQTAGESTGPLIGAALGLVLAAVLCLALYRRVRKINLTRFFTWTGAGLIVIAAGVLGYGLRDLQEGGVLPGVHAFAVDLSGSIDANSWYATLIQGVFNLTTQRTWLQITAYVVYLAAVMALFLRGVRAPKAEPAAEPHAAAPAPMTTPHESRGRRRRWLVPVAVVAVPAAVAGTVIAAGGGKPAAAATVSVSPTACGTGFTAPKLGQQTFQMHNTGNATSEVYLIDPASNAVFGEIEGLAPGTTRALTATIGSGSYAWRCVPTGGTAVTSAAVTVTGRGAAAKPVLPLAAADLDAPLAAYKAYVETGLAVLVTDTDKLKADLHSGSLAQARTDWLTAHLQYSSLGAAYGTFADFDQKINGRADGLPDGVHDKDFTGFHRLEYGLWHSEPATSLAPVADTLSADTAGLRKAFPTQDFDPTNLPLRTHEILENTLQFELTADTDQGSGTNLATAGANLAGTKELLSALRPLIIQRNPALISTVDADSDRLSILLNTQHRGSTWTPVEQLAPATHAAINGATGQLLEDLAPVPDLLEIRKSA